MSPSTLTQVERDEEYRQADRDIERRSGPRDGLWSPERRAMMLARLADFPPMREVEIDCECENGKVETEVTARPNSDDPFEIIRQTCEDCDGTGLRIVEVCEGCQGSETGCECPVGLKG